MKNASYLMDYAQEMLERISEKQKEMQRLGLDWQQPISEEVSARNFVLFFVDVEDLQSFKIGLTLLLQSEHKDQQRQLFEHLISQKNRYTIEPNRRYTSQEYNEIFNNKLQLCELSLQVGDIPIMEQMLNEILGMSEFHPQDDVSARICKLAQKVEVLWLIAPDIGIPSLMNMAYASADELIALCNDGAPDQLPLTLEMLSSKYLTLAKNCFERTANLNKAIGLLEDARRRHPLSELGAENWVRICCELENYPKAKQVFDFFKVNSPELYRLSLLTSLEEANAFRERFGPFSASIYAECKGIYVTEAWKNIWGETIPISSIDDTKVGGILISQNVVVYETNNQTGVGSQADVMLHEMIHVGVRDGQVYKSEGEWFPAKRDVPTAALFTYATYLKESKEKGLKLPDILEFFITHGKTSAINHRDTIDYNIRAMLEYFDTIREESNACYSCAAILAGIAEVIFEGDNEKIFSYVSHLKVFDHDEALDKARRLVPLIL